MRRAGMVNKMNRADDVITEKTNRLIVRIGFSVIEAQTIFPFRTFIGPGRTAVEELVDHVEGIFVILDLEPRSIDRKVMEGVQESLTSGRAVLLLARTREVRDHARREVVTWYNSWCDPQPSVLQ